MLGYYERFYAGGQSAAPPSTAYDLTAHLYDAIPDTTKQASYIQFN